MRIEPLRPEDKDKPIQFAIVGMQFGEYITNGLLCRLFGRSFWYMEWNRATQVIAAYDGDTLAGVLLAKMEGEKPLCRSVGRAVYVKVAEFLGNTVFRNSMGGYERVNREMLEAYHEKCVTDGEILFLAANPNIVKKGVGSLLLAELERREKGKQVYLFTDDFCTYPFYERRGFSRVGEKKIAVDGDAGMKCMLYSKVL